MRIRDLLEGLLIVIVFFGGPLLAWFVVASFPGL